MDRIELKSAPALVAILGAIVFMALAVIRYDDFYLKPICVRFGEEKQMEYVSHHGSGRYNRTSYCTYRLYNEDGSFKTQVQVPISSMKRTPFEWFLGFARWFLIFAILIPGVWLARKLAGAGDD